MTISFSFPKKLYEPLSPKRQAGTIICKQCHPSFTWDAVMRFPIFQQKMYSSPSNEILFLLLVGELLAQGWVGDATTSQPDRLASIIQKERKKKIDESIKRSSTKT